MTSYTEKLNLGKPAQHEANWHIPINANFDGIDSKLGPLYENIFIIDGNTYISSNATWNGSSWVRKDTSKGASVIKMDKDNEKIIFMTCTAGLGDIAWTEIGTFSNTTNLGDINVNTINVATVTVKATYEERKRFGGSSFSEVKTKIAEITIPSKFNNDSTMRFWINAYNDNYSSVTFYLYKNGIEIDQYTEHYDNTTFTHYFDDLNVNGGDLIELYGEKENSIDKSKLNYWAVGYSTPWSWDS